MSKNLYLTKKYSLSLYDINDDLIKLIAYDIFGKNDISTYEKRQLFQMFNEDDPVLGYFEYKDGSLIFNPKHHLSSLLNNSQRPTSPISRESNESYADSFDTDPDSPRASKRKTLYSGYLIDFSELDNQFILTSPESKDDSLGEFISINGDVIGRWNPDLNGWSIRPNSVSTLMVNGAKLKDGIKRIIPEAYDLVEIHSAETLV